MESCYPKKAPRQKGFFFPPGCTSDHDQSVLQKMPDPRRPWRYLEWRRMSDYYHACQYVQQLADGIFRPSTESQRWAKRMREHLKTVARVLQAASGPGQSV
jgi:hypothetical protein